MLAGRITSICHGYILFMAHIIYPSLLLAVHLKENVVI